MPLVDWSKPTERDLAAAAWAAARRPSCMRPSTDWAGEPVLPLNEFRVAEIILGARELLFYHQASDWAKAAPEMVDPDSARVFQQGATIALKLIDAGVPWQTLRIATGPAEAKALELVLMDFGGMLRFAQQHSLTTVAATWWVFFDLVLSVTWERRFRDKLRRAHAAIAAAGGKADG